MVSTNSTTTPNSPWRRIFEDVRRIVGNKRDANGVLGSINWLRKQMEQRGANPNVVRNIIYRDKGKLADKRVLFEILSGLWEESGQAPLQAPELEVLLSAGSSTEQEVMQLLGREKRRAYQNFVSNVRNELFPKLLVTGRPGSGKTLLTDYIQQALEIAPRAADHIVRIEFSSNDLAASLARLARALGIPQDLFESRLVKVDVSSAFAVQADAQADIARLFLDALRHREETLVMLFHISQSLSGQDSLGVVPLRLNTPEVPRVSATEWLWLSLLEPVSRMSNISLMVSMTDVPARALQQLGRFEGPVKLSPPTISEARRFVKTRLPHLPPNQQEALVQRAGRSYEELRTLTLLAEIREPLLQEKDEGSEEHIEQLSQLVQSSGDKRLREFLAILAVLSIPEFPTFDQQILASLRRKGWRELSSLELAFLDAVPGVKGQWRCFSRQLARALRYELLSSNLMHYRALNLSASEHYQEAAQADPRGEEAARYLYHLFEARDWNALETWLNRHSIQQSLLRRLWQAATEELSTGDTFERIAQQVAAHYVKLGSYCHPDAVSALDILAASKQAAVRAWTKLKRAEGAVLKGRFKEAEALLEDWPDTADPVLNAEVALVKANIARWRSQLDDAAALVETRARAVLPHVTTDNSAGRLVHAKVAVWAGLIAKDSGNLEGALKEFGSVQTDDDLIRARIAFQVGDVQLQLGCFDAALQALNEAVMLSHRSEAPVQEQARYLARRGTLHRRRDELQRAAEDFQAALVVLESATEVVSPKELAFERAKIEDERALNLLAVGKFEEATFVLQGDLAAFRAYQDENRVDATYRILRNTLRLGLTYWCRGLNQPYRLPFGQPSDDLRHPDLTHAAKLMQRILNDVQDPAEGRKRFGSLYWRSLLVLSMVSARAEEAVTYAQAALQEARFAYPQAISRAYLAAALLRQGAVAEVLEQLQQAKTLLARARQLAQPKEQGDRGLLAWLVTLELRTLILKGDVQHAGDRLIQALDNLSLRPYHEAIIRAYGDAIESSLELGWLEHPGVRHYLQLDGTLPEQSVRLPDALVSHWLRLRTSHLNPIG